MREKKKEENETISHKPNNGINENHKMFILKRANELI